MSAGPDTFPTRRIPLVELRRDGGTQVRAEMNAATVEDYAAALADGAAFPPVVVFFDGERHWLADGFHRVAAHEAAGVEDVLAEVRQGTREDALWFALSANKRHGLPMSNADKQRAVKLALAARPGEGDRAIAAHVGVSHHTVARVRGEIVPHPVGQVAQLPTTRTGKDGKQYPTRKTKATVEKAPTKTDAEPDEYTLHPLLAEIEGAADLDALDRAFNKVAAAGLDEDGATTAGDIYRRRKMELRAAAGEVDTDALVKRLTDAVATMTYAQHEAVMDSIIAAHASKVITQEQWAALDKAWWEKLNALKREMAKAPPAPTASLARVETPTPAPPRGQMDLLTQPSVAVFTREPTPQPVSAETVTVSKAEWEAMKAEIAGSRQWQATIAQLVGAADSAIAERVIRLIALASSPNEHEAASAALKACRMIRERGLFVATSAQTANVSGVGSSAIIEALRKESVEFWAEMARQVRDAIQRRA